MDMKRYRNLQALKGELLIMADEEMTPNFSELSRLYGMDRHTIAKYWHDGTVNARKVRGSVIDQYVVEIEEKLEHTHCTKYGMYRWLCNNHPELTVSYSTFAHYTQRHEISFKRSKADSVSHVRFETEPGQQMQVDWKEDITFTYRSGETIIFNLYTATFSYSRKHIFIFSIGKGTYDFIRCTLEVLRMIGGKPKEILTDNMSAITNHHTGKLLPEINQFAKDIGIQIKRAKPRSPQTKGKCESANRFVQWLMPYQNELEGITELLQEIKKMEQDSNKKTNMTTGIPPYKLFKKEMEYLTPLPNKTLMDSYIREILTQQVPQTQLIRYNGAQYSVPKKYIGKNVRIIPEADTLYVYHNTQLISVHSKAQANSIKYNPGDYIEGLRASIGSRMTEDEIREIAVKNMKLLENLIENKKEKEHGK